MVLGRKASRDADDVATLRLPPNGGHRDGEMNGPAGRMSPCPEPAGRLPSLRHMKRSGAVSAANFVHTPAALDRLLAEKSACWQWAAFTGVLVQRRASVASQRLEQELRLATQTGRRLQSRHEVGLSIRERLTDVTNVFEELKAFDLTPPYGDVRRSGEGTADADGIVHVANGADGLSRSATASPSSTGASPYQESTWGCAAFAWVSWMVSSRASTPSSTTFSNA
ncbi:MAG: hypothetical protein QOF25_5769 [Mycobacterium sp.]|jgi:hypothetical protein|nr:hypothetical protein [Mycobacterium sp.]